MKQLHNHYTGIPIEWQPILGYLPLWLPAGFHISRYFSYHGNGTRIRW